jgi:hypothetical protein
VKQRNKPARTVYLAIDPKLASIAPSCGCYRLREPAGHRLSRGKWKSGGASDDTTGHIERQELFD